MPCLLLDPGGAEATSAGDAASCRVCAPTVCLAETWGLIWVRPHSQREGRGSRDALRGSGCGESFSGGWRRDVIRTNRCAPRLADFSTPSDAAPASGVAPPVIGCRRGILEAATGDWASGRHGQTARRRSVAHGVSTEFFRARSGNQSAERAATYRPRQRHRVHQVLLRHAAGKHHVG
jgi:hypothetical protein